VGRIVYDVAMSANGYIADRDNSLDWLLAVDDSDLPDEGMIPDKATVLVEGSTTYEWVLGAENLLAKPEKWHRFYGTKPTFVFSRRDLPVPHGADVRFVRGSVVHALPGIRAAAGDGDIWVVGGGDLAGQFLDAGALDSIALTIAPVLLDGGAPVLPRRADANRMRLISAAAYGRFARLVYAVESG